ncbi:MAG: hypothetical protein AAGI38_10810 [Bacteroidota bacterium]
MKCLSFSLLLYLICTLGYAQRPYATMLHEDAHWVTSLGSEPMLDAFETTLMGDTILNGMRYHKAYTQQAIRFQDPRDSTIRYLRYGEKRLRALMREDSSARKVYAILVPNSFLSSNVICPVNQELLWYDFSVDVGDSVYNCGSSDDILFTITSIELDSNLNGEYFPAEIISSPAYKYDADYEFPTDPSHYWEGIGRHTGFLFPFIKAGAQIGSNQLTLYCRDSLLGCRDRFVKPAPPAPVRPYRPLVHEDAHWITESRFWPFPLYETTISGDTIANGVLYKKVYGQKIASRTSGSNQPPYTQSAPKKLDALIREDTVARKVYAIFSYQSALCPPNQEFLLYDFSVDILETMVHCERNLTYLYAREFRSSKEAVSGTNGIVGIDSLNYFYYASEFSNNIFISSENNHRTFVEGIGSISGLLNTGIQTGSPDDKLLSYCRESLGGCPEIWLLNNESPHDSHLNWEVTQDYTRQVLRIRFPQDRPDAVVVYDLSGREVMRKDVERQSELEVSLAQFPTGMYVVGAEFNHQVVARKKVVNP